MSAGSDRDIIAQMYGSPAAAGPPDIYIPPVGADTPTVRVNDMKKFLLALVVSLALAAVGAGVYYTSSTSKYALGISAVIGLAIAIVVMVLSKFVLKW